jgi:hypothetical protein
MPAIKPISDLRDYLGVLREINAGDPVFLTDNGRGRYVIEDMEDYEKTRAVIKLFSELAEGEKSIETEGLCSIEEVSRELGIV